MKEKATNNTYPKKRIGVCGAKIKTGECQGSYVVQVNTKVLAEICKKCPMFKN